MRRRFLAAVLAVLWPAGLVAQPAVSPTSGSLTLDYRSGDYDGGAYEATGLSFSTELGEARGFSASLAGTFGAYENESADYWTSSAEAAPRYRFAGGPVLGGYYARLGYIDGSETVSLSSYGLAAGVAHERWAALVFGGLSEESPEMEGVEGRDLGFALRAGLQRASFAGSAMRTRLDYPGGSGDITSLALGSLYEDEGWSVYGGLSQSGTEDILGQELRLRSTGLGAAFDLAPLSLPLSVSVELVRHEFETVLFEDRADEIRIGLSLPLGAGGGPPAGSVASGAFGSAFTGFNPEVLAAF